MAVNVVGSLVIRGTTTNMYTRIQPPH